MENENVNEFLNKKDVTEYLFEVVKKVWPFIIVSIAAEFLIRIILKPLISDFDGLAKYITLIKEGIYNDVLFGDIFRGILPILIPLIIFIAVRYAVDFFANPGLYNACFVYFANGKTSSFKDIFTNTLRGFLKYTKYRLLMLGIWVAYLVFCAIVLSALLLIGLFLGDFTVAYVILLFVVFALASIIMPLRLSLTYPLSRLDDYHLDDALSQSVKATSRPYHYLRLVTVYIGAFLLQMFLIYLFPLGSPDSSISTFAVASIAAGFVRFLMTCFITAATIEMRKPRPIDLNGIW